MSDLETIREQLLKQDNRGTEHPVFVVEREERVYARRPRLGYTPVWAFETACFTDVAAKRYIAENSHNGTFRVFVYSAHRNPEWQAVRALLMEREAQRERADAAERERDRLAQKLAAAQTEGEHWRADFEAELKGRRALRKKFGALEHETMGDFITRIGTIAAVNTCGVFVTTGASGEVSPPLCDYCKGPILPGARVHVEGGRAWHGCEAHAPTAHAHPLDDWSDAAGIVCWWTERDPTVRYLGTPLDDDFPDDVTHWTPVVRPSGFEPAGAQ